MTRYENKRVGRSMKKQERAVMCRKVLEAYRKSRNE